MSYVARCPDCKRISPRTTHEAATVWAKEHRCDRLSEEHARRLAVLGAALAFTPDRGWHLIDMAEAFELVSRCA